MYENIALLHYENNFLKQMIDAFEKALYYRQKLEDKDGCEKILKLFASMREELRKEAGDEAKSMSFPKEMKESRQPVNLSNTNY